MLITNNNLMLQVQLKNHISSYLTDAFIDAIERFEDLVHKLNQEVDKITKSDYIDVFMGNSKSLVIKQAACLSSGLNRNVAVEFTVLRVLWNKFYTFILVISKFPVVEIDDIFCVMIQTAQIQAPFFEGWKKGLGPMATLFIKQPYLEVQNCEQLQIIKVAIENAEIKKTSKYKGDVNQIKAIGNEYFKNNDFINALNYYEYGLACCHKHSDANTRAILYSNSAASLYKLNLFENSLKYCAIAIKIDRSYYKSFAWKVHCLLERKNFGEIPNLLIVLKSRAGAEDFNKINLKYSIYLSNSLGMYNWKNIVLQAKKNDVFVGDYFSKHIGIRIQDDKQVYYALEDIKKQSIMIISKPLVYDKKGSQNMSSIYKNIVKCFQLQKSSFNSSFKQLIVPTGETISIKQNPQLQYKSIENRIKRFLIKPRDMLSSETQALGIWPQLIKFSHSCNPNCSVIHFDNIMVISTCTHVSYGETLTLDFATDILPLKRKQFLLQKYNIYCKCAICQWKSWPDFSNKDEVSKVTDSLTNITMIKQVFWQLMSTGYNNHQQSLLEKTTKLVIREINWADMLMAIRLIRTNNPKTGEILMQVLVAGFKTFLKVSFEFAIELTNLIK